MPVTLLGIVYDPPLPPGKALSTVLSLLNKTPSITETFLLYESTLNSVNDVHPRKGLLLIPARLGICIFFKEEQ